MTRDTQVLVYVGIKGSVIALDEQTGTEVWRAHLRGVDYVSVIWDGEALLAASDGEVWRLDERTGGVLWHNELKGLGRGIAGLASGRRSRDGVVSDADAAQHHQNMMKTAASA